MPGPSRSRRCRSLHSLIAKNNQSISTFSTEAQTLFEFLALIVDIKHRQEFGYSLGDGDTRYGNRQLNREVVADQIPSVEADLLRR
jgi:hypothetical protein